MIVVIASAVVLLYALYTTWALPPRQWGNQPGIAVAQERQNLRWHGSPEAGANASAQAEVVRSSPAEQPATLSSANNSNLLANGGFELGSNGTWYEGGYNRSLIIEESGSACWSLLPGLGRTQPHWVHTILGSYTLSQKMVTLPADGYNVVTLEQTISGIYSPADTCNSD